MLHKFEGFFFVFYEKNTAPENVVVLGSEGQRLLHKLLLDDNFLHLR